MESGDSQRKIPRALSFEREFYRMIAENGGRVGHHGWESLEQVSNGDLFSGDSLLKGASGFDALSFAMSKYCDYVMDRPTRKTADKFEKVIKDLLERPEFHSMTDVAIAIFLASDFLVSSKRGYLGLFASENRDSFIDRINPAGNAKQMLVDYRAFRGASIDDIRIYLESRRGDLDKCGLTVGVSCASLSDAEELMRIEGVGDIDRKKAILENVGRNAQMVSGLIRASLTYKNQVPIVINLRERDLEDRLADLEEEARLAREADSSDVESVSSDGTGVMSESSVELELSSDSKPASPARDSRGTKVVSPIASPLQTPRAIAI